MADKVIVTDYSSWQPTDNPVCDWQDNTDPQQPVKTEPPEANDLSEIVGNTSSTHARTDGTTSSTSGTRSSATTASRAGWLRSDGRRTSDC